MDIDTLNDFSSCDEKNETDIDIENIVYIKHNGQNLGQNQNKSNELVKIDGAIYDLELSMNRYMDNVIEIWKTLIVPFMNSSDCLTLHYTSDTDYDKFIALMMKHDLYVKMVNMHKSLIARRKYIS